jgi:hypothetical protein
VPRTKAAPAWVSTGVGPLFAGPSRSGTVLAATSVASYVTVPGPDRDTTLFALLVPGAVRLPIGVCIDEIELPEQGSEVHIGEGVVSDGDW